MHHRFTAAAEYRRQAAEHKAVANLWMLYGVEYINWRVMKQIEICITSYCRRVRIIFRQLGHVILTGRRLNLIIAQVLARSLRKQQ